MTATTSNRVPVLSEICCFMSVSWHNHASASALNTCARRERGTGGRAARARMQTLCNLLFPTWGNIVSTAQTYWKGTGTRSTTLFQQALSWASQQMCWRPWSSAPDHSGVWIRPTLHLISFDRVVLIGCTSRIKEYHRAWEGLTKSDFWKAAISFSILKAI